MPTQCKSQINKCLGKTVSLPACRFHKPGEFFFHAVHLHSYNQQVLNHFICRHYVQDALLYTSWHTGIVKLCT